MSRNLALEAKMHEDFGAWASDHAERYPEIKVVDYDPEAHPEQKIDVAKTLAMINRAPDDPSVLRYLALKKEKNGLESVDYPSEVLQDFDNYYARTLGGWTKARSFRKAFRTTTVDPDGEISIADATAERLERGESVGIVMDHAEDLFDFAKILGGLSLTVAETHKHKYLGRFSGWVNKLMTRESYAGMYMPDLIAWGGNMRWTIPSTENADKYVTDPEISRVVNHAAVRSFIEDSKQAGAVEVLIPSGSAMKKVEGKNGKKILSSPPIPDVSANLLSKFDILIPCTAWSGRLAVGRIIEVPDHLPAGKKDRVAERKLAELVREILRSQTQELSGLQVVFQEDLES